jgi:hypothetical protein
MDPACPLIAIVLPRADLSLRTRSMTMSCNSSLPPWLLRNWISTSAVGLLSAPNRTRFGGHENNNWNGLVTRHDWPNASFRNRSRQLAGGCRTGETMGVSPAGTPADRGDVGTRRAATIELVPTRRRHPGGSLGLRTGDPGMVGNQPLLAGAEEGPVAVLDRHGGCPLRCPGHGPLSVVWKGGETTEAHLGGTVGAPACLSGRQEMEDTILRLAQQGQSDEEIACQLTQQGYRSPKHRSVLPGTIRLVRLNHRLLRDPPSIAPSANPWLSHGLPGGREAEDPAALDL